MSTLITIGIIILFVYFWDKIFSSSSKQFTISCWGYKKIPKLILKIAGIHSDKKDISWKDLDKSEEQKVLKITEKFENVAFRKLTFLYNQNLIHVSSQSGAYFFPIDKENKNVVYEEVARFDENKYLTFVIHRRKRGFFRSPVLIGYLKVDYDVHPPKKDEEEIEILFEFPESLVSRTFFTGSLEKEFSLKKDVVADYIQRNELGDPEGIYYTNYDQEDKYPCNFHFQIP